MIDYKNELGKTLTLVLKTIKKSEKPLTRDDLATTMKLSKRLAADALESLWERGVTRTRKKCFRSQLNGLLE